MLLYFVSPVVLYGVVANAHAIAPSRYSRFKSRLHVWLYVVGKQMSMVFILIFLNTRICSSLACSAVRCANSQSTPPRKSSFLSWGCSVLRASQSSMHQHWSLKSEYTCAECAQPARSAYQYRCRYAVSAVWGTGLCIATSLCCLLSYCGWGFSTL
jgi:hypothetical protein